MVLADGCVLCTFDRQRVNRNEWLYTVAEQTQIPNLPAAIEDGNREIEPSLLGSRLMLTTSRREEGRLGRL